MQKSAQIAEMSAKVTGGYFLYVHPVYRQRTTINSFSSDRQHFSVFKRMDENFNRLCLVVRPFN